jgi:hypothetical protein
MALPARPLSAKQQSKNTLINSTNTSQVLITDETVTPKRTRTSSTSSVDTIRASSGKKKFKRARASEPSSNGGYDQNSLEDMRRGRQRKSSTSTTEAVRGNVAFPTFSDEITTPQQKEIRGKEDVQRKVTPPKLNPGHAAPSVAVTSITRVSSPPTAIRHAPPPPIVTTTRSRVLSIRPSLPAHRRPSGFEPLPMHLQDWQPHSASYSFSDDEGSVYDGEVLGAPWKDQDDMIHPGVSDLDLSISFHKRQPFFDVWDLPDDIYIAVPARLHLSLRNHRQWEEISSEPNLRYIDIKCHTFDYRPLSEYFPPEYSVSYNGASSTEYADPSVIPADLTRGIIVNMKWHKTYPGSRIYLKESLITSHGRLPDDSSIETHDEEDNDATAISKQGWFCRFMIPIPSWVLRQGNTRAFTVEASAWIGGLDDGGLVRGDTEFVISHLRSEREMAKGGGGLSF